MAANRKRKPKGKASEKLAPGIGLEKVVARLQQMLDPNTVVTHNEKITNRAGVPTQFDVVVRAQLGGMDILGILECRDHKRKKGPAAIQAFAGIAGDVNANFKTMVSRKGFTKNGLIQAQFLGVGAWSVLPQDLSEAELKLDVVWYGREYRWQPIRVSLWSPDGNVEGREFRAEEITLHGMPVTNWFLRKLSTTYNEVTELKTLRCAVQFNPPRTLDVAGQAVEVSVIVFEATRICHIKKKRMPISGDGFYDWLKQEPKVPPLGKLSMHDITPIMSKWEDHDGEIPQALGPWQWIVNSFPFCIDEHVEVIDLENLGRLE